MKDNIEAKRVSRALMQKSLRELADAAFASDYVNLSTALRKNCLITSSR